MIDSFYWEKYRWEFMRRNAEFRRGYDEYLKEKEKKEIIRE